MIARRSQKTTIDADFNEMDSSDQMMNRLFTVVREDPKLSEQMQHIHTDHGAIKRIFDIAEDLDVIPDDQATHIRQDRQFRERIHSAVDKVVRKGQEHKKVAVFTSGGPIAVALRRTLDTSREQTLRLGWALRNTSITVLRYDQRQLWLVLFNCVSHLEAQNNPGLLTYI
jgi:broad specificity phosphatase PhoE